ncbi:NAD-P-binding protein [Stereum hirsutum FP-91666 SS1]|uniref:NAD-P-binding protein n=1 Tax=Stereum hirsutum (strain FP-91666) TaxID=721885 RepID=UPI0004449786|nr:NAD-P-binding protein [Stereum hirsutum FP-91666 SS1]EIM84945.1 NAD-P-binding protein [Stereum hirsutum FP-91666 SS1]
MTTLTDDLLLVHADRVQDKVVIVTGGASGIGKESCILFAQYGAKIVIGDVDEKAGMGVVENITSAGGDAVFIRCDVTSWDDQVSMFELALSRYGSVDVVVVNAGILDKLTDSWTGELKGSDGRLQPPSLKVIDVNVYGALYTIRLALYYFVKKSTPQDLKSLVVMGSLASWISLPFGPPLYGASKHAMLGTMRNLSASLPGQPETKHIRVSCIHPWYADTNILDTPTKLFVAGVPLAPVLRIAYAIFNAATDPDMSTSGSAYLLLDDGPVLRLEKEVMKSGVYEVMNKRVSWIQSATGNEYIWAVLKDVKGLFSWKMLLALLFLPVLILMAFVRVVLKVATS